MKYGVRSLVARTQSLNSSFSRLICLKLVGYSQHHLKSMFLNIFCPFVWETSTFLSFVFFFFFFFCVFRVFFEITKNGVRYLVALTPSIKLLYFNHLKSIDIGIHCIPRSMYPKQRIFYILPITENLNNKQNLLIRNNLSCLPFRFYERIARIHRSCKYLNSLQARPKDTTKMRESTLPRETATTARKNIPTDSKVIATPANMQIS